MKNFRNFRRNKHRNNVRSFKSNTATKFNDEFNISGEFKRKKISKNINASKLIEKYTELAKEALSNGDKILSENYLQHADHFSRIIAAQETVKDNYNQEKNLHQKNVEDKKSSTDSENKDNESRTISSD